jgi:AcrR family transcriptional regulator
VGDSARRAELLVAAYAYAAEHGLTDLSLRPLAAATGTSPRVLLYLFGSKDGLVREILSRARQEQLDFVHEVDGRPPPTGAQRYPYLVDRLWDWVSAPHRRGIVRLFFEAYTRSTRSTPGPWDGFAEQSVQDLVGVLTDAQPELDRAVATRHAVHTLALLRGLLLQLLAVGGADELGEVLRQAVHQMRAAPAR